MKISASFTNTEIGKNNTTFKGIPQDPKYIPEIVGEAGKLAGEYVSMPEQKLFLAMTALMFQPLIDLKFANDEQKHDAAIKSASKAIAGGITGVSIRALFLKITDKYIGFGKHNKLNTHFFPDNAVHINETRPEIAKLYMKQYNKTLGTLFAILTMILFTNAKIDVPLTSDLQDFITGIAKDDKSWAKSFKDVKDSRILKIKNWFKHKKQFFKKLHSKVSDVILVIRDSSKYEAKPEEKTKEASK